MYNAFTGKSGMTSGIDNLKQLKKHCFTGEELKEFAEHCVKYASQQREWIPVEEHLPYGQGRYLCVIKDLTTKKSMKHMVFYNASTKMWAKYFTVTHWYSGHITLPSPPSKG
jgi:hypothetical protein